VPDILLAGTPFWEPVRVDPSMTALGWDSDRERQFAPLAAAGLVPARVLAVHRGHVAVHDRDELAPVAGIMHHRAAEEGQPALPATGDWVGLEPGGAVREVLPRRGAIRRGAGRDVEVVAANVDLAILATSLNRELNVRRLERMLAIAADDGIQTIVLLTKGDLPGDPAATAAGIERQTGAPTIPISVYDGWGMPALQRHLRPGRTAVVLGSSGVGKSTLVNALLGEARQRVLEVRTVDDRGRHATTHRELFPLPGGALLIDTPGVREASLPGADGVEEAFEDVVELAAQCRFSDCTHASEPGCAVREAVEAGELEADRVAAYGQLAEEARRFEEAQRRRRAPRR